jgi:Uma2 family endonuclease
VAVETPTPPIQPHRFTLDEYHQLVDSGGLDEDSRVELIEGVIADMSPKTPRHERAIRWLTRWLLSAVDPEHFEVGVQTALTLERSEPEPDFSVLPRNAPQPYHPATAALVIEVAVSSQDRDLRQKPPIYARAGILEYWVIDLDRGRVVVHRDPQGDGRYATIIEIPANGSVEARALTLPVLSVAELLAVARR